MALCRFIPSGLLTQIRECGEMASKAVEVFESSHEAPDVIWTPACRTHLRNALDELIAKRVKAVESVPGPGFETWDIPELFQIEYPELNRELQICGIFVRVSTCLLINSLTHQLINLSTH